MGFDGKTLIHPTQVEPCNDVFAPSAEEVAAAREIIAAFEETPDGRWAVLPDGTRIRMVVPLPS